MAIIDTQNIFGATTKNEKFNSSFPISKQRQNNLSGIGTFSEANKYGTSKFTKLGFLAKNGAGAQQASTEGASLVKGENVYGLLKVISDTNNSGPINSSPYIKFIDPNTFKAKITQMV